MCPIHASNGTAPEALENGFSWNTPDSFDPPSEYDVYVWYLNHDEKRLTRSGELFSIPVFEGQRDIKSLPVFPIEYHDDQGLRQQLIDRGKKFVDLMKNPGLHEFTGPSMLHGNRKVSFVFTPDTLILNKASTTARGCSSTIRPSHGTRTAS